MTATDRYPFQYTEKKCHDQWAALCWKDAETPLTLLDALKADIRHRLAGDTPFLTDAGNQALLSWGILSCAALENTASFVQQARLYGADAMRLCLILEKEGSPIPYWRLVQSLWHSFHAVPASDRIDAFSHPAYALLHRAVTQHDFYHALIHLKTLSAAGETKSFLKALWAPFIPHVMQEALAFSAAAYHRLATASVFIPIQVNGAFCMLYAPQTEEPEKEILSIPKIRHKIGARTVQKTIYIKDKIFNVVCV